MNCRSTYASPCLNVNFCLDGCLIAELRRCGCPKDYARLGKSCVKCDEPPGEVVARKPQQAPLSPKRFDVEQPFAEDFPGKTIYLTLP